ncbi:SFI1 [Candida jiufengensis]|uniref:SFI1 n=1 Tax=Candida jiufengensis TaxID=497108 RepID=UPI002225AFD2|nr:SFI1 [Candida jiufengensis]KAI5949426.1 SFI1 [Candida jiufengensis]
MNYKEQLLNIFNEIEQLYGYEAVENLKEYENVLNNLIKELLILLQLDQISLKLIIKTNIETIGTFSVWCHGNINDDPISIEHITQYLKSSFINDSTLHHIYHYLIENPINHYEEAAQKLLEIVENLLEMQDYTENYVIDHLNHCLLYDLNYYKSNEMEIPENIDLILNLINSHIRIDKNDSTIKNEVEILLPLSLTVSNSNFSKIYKTISQLLIVRPDLPITQLSRIIINLFKKHEGVSFYDAERIDINLARLFPRSLKKINLKYLGGPKESMILPQLSQVVNDLSALDFIINPNFIQIYKTFLRFRKLFPALSCKYDYEYSKKIEDSVSDIIELEAGENFKIAIEEFIQLQSIFTSNSSTLLMRLSYLEFKKVSSMKKNTLELWMHKSEEVQKLELVDYKLQKLSRYLKKWIKNAKLYDELSGIAILESEERLKKRVLKKLMCDLNKTREMSVRAAARDRSKYINIIQNRSRIISDHYIEVQNSENKKLILNMLKKWKSRTKSVLQNKDTILYKCDNFIKAHESRLLLDYYLLWGDRLQGNSNAFDLNKRLYQFIQHRKQVLVQVCFNRWLNLQRMNTQCNEIIKQREEKLRLAVFKVWKNDLQSEMKVNWFLQNRINKIAYSTLVKWNLETKSMIKVRKMDQQALMKTFIKKWIMEHKLGLLNVEKKKLVMRKYCKIILNQAKAGNFISLRNKGIAKNVMELLENKYQDSIIKQKSAYSTFDMNIKKKYLNQLMMVKQNIEESQIEADNFYIHKIFQNWLKKLHMWDREIDGLSFSDKFSIRFMIQIWKRKLDIIKEQKLEQFLENFKQNAELNLKSKFLSIVRTRYFETQIKIDQLNHRLELFIPRVSFFFSHWYEKTKKVYALEDRLYEISDKLIAKLYVQWRNKLDLVDDLNEQADDHFTEKNFDLLRSKVQSWIFQFNKNIKRHYQLCESFQERKNNRLKRTAFHLWSQKCTEKQLEEEEELLADSTYVSHSSPLAKRTYQQQRQKYILPPTPNKPPSPRKITTPKSTNGTSPIKLQETSLRIRDQQINNLRERFSRARASSTPKKKEITLPMKLDYTVSLSPPKYKSPEQISPASNSSFDDPEISLLSTAKRMGRIKPIKFPVNDENEVKFSPPNKLKVN